MTVHVYDHFHRENLMCIVMGICQISIADWVYNVDHFHCWQKTFGYGYSGLSAVEDSSTRDRTSRYKPQHSVSLMERVSNCGLRFGIFA